MIALVARDGIVCFIICFGYSPSVSLPAGDTFCATYERVIKNKEESDTLKAIPPEIRKRIQGNDLDYLCTCQGWEDNACLLKSNRK